MILYILKSISTGRFSIHYLHSFAISLVTYEKQYGNSWVENDDHPNAHGYCPWAMVVKMDAKMGSLANPVGRNPARVEFA